MNLRLRILNGPMKGKHAVVEEGIIIGRGPGTLSLTDSKISSRHATIGKNSAGQWVLKDLGSTNGIVVKGKKIAKLILTPGVRFILGRTVLEAEVLEQAKPSAEPQAVAEDPAIPEIEAPPQTFLQQSAEPPPILWPEYFSDFIQKTTPKVKNKVRAIEPFSRVLRLRWLRGIQIEWEWYVGYGPRVFGAGSVDYPIHDESQRNLSFTIRPSAKGPVLECAKTNTVLLNNRPAKADVLKEGDVIAFGENLIEVSFVEPE